MKRRMDIFHPSGTCIGAVFNATVTRDQTKNDVLIISGVDVMGQPTVVRAPATVFLVETEFAGWTP